MKKILFAGLLFLMVLGCKKNKYIQPGSGPIQIYVNLYDQLGAKLPTSAADSVIVTVYRSDSNNSDLKKNIPYLIDTTNASGVCNFNNKNIPSDTLTFVFAKKGYGTIIKYNVFFTPESAPDEFSVNLASVSKATVSNLTFTPGYTPATSTVSAKDSIWITCSISPMLSPYSSVRFFWGTESTICADSDYTATVVCNTINNYNAVSPGLVGFYIYPGNYSKDSAGTTIAIDAGTELYAIAYGEVNDPTPYTDITVSTTSYPHGITKYPNLSVSFTKDSINNPY